MGLGTLPWAALEAAVVLKRLAVPTSQASGAPGRQIVLAEEDTVDNPVAIAAKEAAANVLTAKGGSDGPTTAAATDGAAMTAIPSSLISMSDPAASAGALKREAAAGSPMGKL